MSLRRNQRPQSVAELIELMPMANRVDEAPIQQHAAEQNTQIVAQEPAPTPEPQPAQLKTPVASNNEKRLKVQLVKHQIFRLKNISLNHASLNLS